ncbi:ShlB/FhaC/HecB family hemolysin secretion/activation protein [Massilia sp. R2A-15]|uniref:ShlB/FhaC/HecB family hemolysin secretion/activation protein n=1 Tax=Massilia sp. R2A-15 TaxID=3064278 RepID=UPI0027325416|nr:ShlB/FhaC/HecB family hemolysin secretion/activation protein [Massilia sp. R2A-15]WLI89444.1 ShlB/FhaC/HecB family hemolysin secretion/activation protein [Massilia sp. R2A-15]
MKMMTITRCLVTAAGCGVAFSVASAVPDQVPGTQTQDPTLKPAQPSKPPAPGMIQGAGPAAAPASPADGATISVSRFTFSGNDSQPDDKLAAQVAPYLGRPLTLAQLGEAADAVKRYYRAQGWFLAQAYIPAQAPASGVVDIAVLEGRIDTVTINVADDAPMSKSYANNLANHFLKSGQTITENGIERPLLLLRDVPRVDAKSVIDPGSTAGTASITVNVVTDPDAPRINGRLEFDNYGSRTTGKNRLGGEINVNNPYGLGDQLSLRGFRANENGNGFGRVGYSLPVGPLGTRVGVSAARLDYVLGKEIAALGANGVANVISANAAHPLMRSKNNNLFLQLVFERKKLDDRTTTPVATSDRRTLNTGRLQLNGDVRDDFSGVTVYSISGMRGDLKIDDPELAFLDQQPDFGARAAGKFNKLMYSVQRLQQLAPPLHLLLSVSGQQSNKNLHAAEKFTIGGDNTVRAFPVGTLVGDHGVAATAELRFAPSMLKYNRFDAVATLFYDYGRTTRNHDNSNLKYEYNSSHISGYGVGLNLGYADKFLLKVSAAWQHKGLDPLDPAFVPKGGARIWAQAAYAF